MRLLPALACLLLLPASAEAQTQQKTWPWLKQGEPRRPVYPEIAVDAAWVREHLGELLPLDVRGEESWLRGRLPGARPLPDLLPRIDEALAGDFSGIESALGREGVDGERSLLLYGDPLSLPEIGRAFWLLEWLGCRDVRVLRGGMSAWTMAGGELRRGAEAPTAARFGAAPVDSLRASARWIAENLGQGSGVELLDLRDRAVWLEERAEPGSAPGHIPHALPVDLGELLEADALPRDLEAARRRFGLFGPRENDYVDVDDRFVLYGGGLGREGLGHLLLRMLDVRARVFPLGWQGWCRDEELPRVRIVKAEELADRLRRNNPGLAEDVAPPDLVLLDLRGWRDHRVRHLPGAISLPAHVVDDSLSISLAEHWPDLDPVTAPIFFYCYGVECTRSRIAASKAARLGFRNLHILRGGVDEWREAGLPFQGRYPELREPPPKRERQPDRPPRKRDPRRG